MITQLISAVKNADVYSLIAICVSAAVLLLVCLPVHEMAHAFTAYSLGDKTAKYEGRLTLNPLKHLDPIGSLMILIIGVGYARPVPVNMMNFKNRKRDMALTAAAGPISNLLMAIIFTFLYVTLMYKCEMGGAFSYQLLLGQKITFLPISMIDKIIGIIIFAVYQGAIINISLAIFNLIPIPPFDGSRILGFFLPDRIYYKIMQYEQIIFIVVLAFLFFGFLDGPLSSMVSTLFQRLVWLFSLLYGGN